MLLMEIIAVSFENYTNRKVAGSFPDVIGFANYLILPAAL
jgi:hypothetical protein